MAGKNVIIDVRLLSRGGLSGIEEYTRLLVSELISGNPDDRFALLYHGMRNAALPSAWTENMRVSVIGEPVPNKLFDLGTRFFGWPKAERWFKADLVLSPHFNLVATGLPHLITFHDLSFVRYPEFFSSRQRFWHWLQNPRIQVEEANRIIAVSEFTKSDLAELWGIPEGRIKVVYSGINPIFRPLSENDPMREATRKKYNLQKPFVLYLGTIEPRKNIPGIIRAFNILAGQKNFGEFELVIAGQPGWLYKEILEEAKRSPWSGRIKFLGKVETGDRLGLYSLSSVFVYPSFFEGFGFPPLEAQAAGIPVVASNRTSLPEILGSSAILVDPWKIGDLYEAIEAALSKKTLRKSLIEKGLRNCSRFSWQQAAREVRNLYYN